MFTLHCHKSPWLRRGTSFKGKFPTAVPRESRGHLDRVMARFQIRCRWTRIAFLLAVAACAFTVADIASACPTCKDSVAQNDPHYQSMAAGYYYSILFMLSMPFLIVTTFSTFAYRSVKRAEAERLAAANSATAVTSA